MNRQGGPRDWLAIWGQAAETIESRAPRDWLESFRFDDCPIQGALDLQEPSHTSHECHSLVPISICCRRWNLYCGEISGRVSQAIVDILQAWQGYPTVERGGVCTPRPQPVTLQTMGMPVPILSDVRLHWERGLFFVHTLRLWRTSSFVAVSPVQFWESVGTSVLSFLQCELLRSLMSKDILFNMLHLLRMLPIGLMGSYSSNGRWWI